MVNFFNGLRFALVLFSTCFLAPSSFSGVNPDESPLELGGGVEVSEKFFTYLYLERRGEIRDELRFVIVSAEIGVERDLGRILPGKIRYAHFDITPVAYFPEFSRFTFGGVPISADSDLDLGLESVYKIRLAQVSYNWGELGLKPGYFAELAGKLLGYQNLRVRGEHDRTGAFDYGTLNATVGKNFALDQGMTISWKALDIEVSKGAHLLQLGLKSQATFVMDQFVSLSLAAGWKGYELRDQSGTITNQKYGWWARLTFGLFIDRFNQLVSRNE